jgi:hypothetical protein
LEAFERVFNPESCIVVAVELSHYSVRVAAAVPMLPLAPPITPLRARIFTHLIGRRMPQ